MSRKKFPEKFLTKKLQEYYDGHNFEEEDWDMLGELYSDIEIEILPEIFSLFHYKLNCLFNFMNSRGCNGNHHYTAHESRMLIYIIEEIKKCSQYLKGTVYEFELFEYYNEVKKCETFLSETGGSTIPEDYEKAQSEIKDYI